MLLTGATGFVGRWLERELAAAGHEVVQLESGIDVREPEPLGAAVHAARPDAIAHLAAVAFAPDANSDPHKAYSVAVVGTANVFEAARGCAVPPAVLVTGSSEVYGQPEPDELPLSERSPLRARGTYGVAKLAQESVALAYSARHDLATVVTRSFNHVGPGQRADFVVPALAQRVSRAVAAGSDHIVVGNLDVRRDLTDVRDVVAAYRLLIEALLEGRAGRPGAVVNVCSGRSVPIRSVAEEFCRLAGRELRFEVDPGLVRSRDAPEVRGDHTLLTALTGWQPTIPLADTLRDVWHATSAGAPAAGGA